MATGGKRERERVREGGGGLYERRASALASPLLSPTIKADRIPFARVAIAVVVVAAALSRAF